MYDACKRIVTSTVTFGLIISCNGTSSSDAPPDASVVDAGDAGRLVDAAVPDFDSGCFGEDCQFYVTMQDIAEVNPPKANTQGSCTDAELAMLKGKFADILAAVSPTCASCLFTEANDTKNTQFYVWSDTMHVNVSLANFGACMGSPLSGGNANCGKAGEELESCLGAACPRDPQGNLVCCGFTLPECIDDALKNSCQPYDQKQTTACGGTTSLAAIKNKCFDDIGPPWFLGIDPGIKLLCGGAPSDAGTDAAADAGDQ